MKALLIVGAALLGAVGLTRFWYSYPDAFPPPLKWLAPHVILRATPEATADAELIYTFAVAVALVSLVAWLALLAVKRLR